MFILLIVFSIMAERLLPPVPSALSVIHSEGTFAFTDGSSVYQFMDDGSFLLEPVSLCGRSIEGSWVELGENSFEITGIWSWYNGISAVDDKRRMVIMVNVLSDEPVSEDFFWSTEDLRLWNVYFIIEELSPLLQL